jgi:hypothetical protein
MKPRSTTIDTRRRNRNSRVLQDREDASGLSFSVLVQTIARTHVHFAARASLAINIGLTLRNWTVGCHIQEFEQRGQERARYGVGLFENLSASLRRNNDIKYHPRELRRCRQFYNAYPQIWGSLTPESRELLVFSLPQLVRPHSAAPHSIPVERLLQSLSFTHFVELLDIDDPIKRAFYEKEAIRGNWTVRELSRQIGALLFERTALSRNKRRVVDQVQAVAETATPENTIRDPYVHRSHLLSPGSTLPRADRAEARKVQARTSRPAQYVPQLVPETRNDRRRQSAHRSASLQQQGPGVGRIRIARPGRSTLRLALSARATEEG